jgi:hypothetical protein
MLPAIAEVISVIDDGFPRLELVRGVEVVVRERAAVLG